MSTKKAVFTIVESKGKNDKPFWNRIGTAFVNRDVMPSRTLC